MTMNRPNHFGEALARARSVKAELDHLPREVVDEWHKTHDPASPMVTALGKMQTALMWLYELAEVEFGDDYKLRVMPASIRDTDSEVHRPMSADLEISRHFGSIDLHLVRPGNRVLFCAIEAWGGNLNLHVWDDKAQADASGEPSHQIQITSDIEAFFRMAEGLDDEPDSSD